MMDDQTTLGLLSRIHRAGLALLLAGVTQIASAQLTVEIGGAGSQQYPVALLGFSGDNADEISAVVRSDLTKSGLFRLISDAQKPDYAQTPNISALRSAGADAVVWGTLSKIGGGFELRLRVQDAVRNVPLDSGVMALRAEPRFAGHQIADRIYEKITGQKGFFTSRLGYVTPGARRG
jgi:TolB protein